MGSIHATIGLALLITTFALLSSQPWPLAASLPVGPGSSMVVSDAPDDNSVDGAGAGPSLDSTGFSLAVGFLVSDYLRNGKDDGSSLFLSRPPRLTRPARRDQLMIIIDILTFTQKPARRKRILRYLNLSQYQLKKYLPLLISKGFLTEELGESRTYRITEKGVELVRLLEGVTN